MNKRTRLLLTSGIHPEEEAGVIVLNKLINDSDFFNICKGIDIQIIPCRNERGYFIEDKLRSAPIHIILEKENILFMENAGDVFFYVKQMESMLNKSYWTQIEQVLSEQQYVGVVGIISNRASDKIRSNHYYFTGRKMVDFNSYSRCIDDISVYSRNNILKNYEFDLWVDLHESIGKDLFLYLDPKDKWMLHMGKRLIEYCDKQKYKLRKDARDRKKIMDGIYDINFMKNRQRNLQKKELILEMGIDNNLDYRVNVYEDILKVLCQIIQVYDD